MNKVGYDRLLPYKEFEGMKVSQYASIPISKDMACPECGGSNHFTYPFDSNIEEPIPVGWCDTEYGFMSIFECPKCFTKFRFHINTTGRNNLDKFYEDFALLVYLYKFHKK